jgi:hypothetical protein
MTSLQRVTSFRRSLRAWARRCNRPRGALSHPGPPARPWLARSPAGTFSAACNCTVSSDCCWPCIMLAISSAARSVNASRASSASGAHGRRCSDTTRPLRPNPGCRAPGWPAPLGPRGRPRPPGRQAIERRVLDSRLRPVPWRRKRQCRALPDAGSADSPDGRTVHLRRPQPANADQRSTSIRPAPSTLNIA